MTSLPGAAAVTVAALFPIMNPVGALPAFGALTAGDDPEFRHRQAIKAAAYAGGLLVVFALVGRPLLHGLGAGLSQTCLAAGAVASAAMLGASGALPLLVGAGAQTAAALIGVSVQSSLLVLILVGRRPSGPGLLRLTARGGAVVVALLFSLSAAGGVHDHPAAALGPQRVAAPTYLCHLL